MKLLFAFLLIVPATLAQSLAVSPTSLSTVTLGTRALTASGGTAPYNWTVAGAATCMMTPSSGMTSSLSCTTTGSATITVTDSAAATATSAATVNWAKGSIDLQTSRLPARNAVTRSVQDKLNETVSITDFGAVDGEIDSTGHLVDGLTKASDLYIPPGVWTIGPTTITGTKKIHGAGPLSILRFATGATGWMLDASAGSLILESLTLEGGDDTDKSASLILGTRSAVYMNVAYKDSGISNVVVRGFSNIGTGFVGDTNQMDASPYIRNSNLYYNGIGIETRVGAPLTGGEYLRISGNSIARNSYGLNIHSGNIDVVGNTITNNNYGVQILWDNNNAHGTLTGNLVNHSTTYGLVADNGAWDPALSYGFSIIGNQFWYGDWRLINVAGFNIAHNTIGVYSIYAASGGVNYLTDNWFPKMTSWTGPGDDHFTLRDNWNGSGYFPMNQRALVANFGLDYDTGSNTLKISRNLVANGNPVTPGPWVLGSGWSISGGKAVSAGSSANLVQAIGVINAHLYKVTYTLSGLGAWPGCGGINLGVGGAVLGPFHNQNGIYTDILVATSAVDGNLYFIPSAFVGSVSNVSAVDVVGGISLSEGSISSVADLSISTVGNAYIKPITGSMYLQGPGVANHFFTYDYTTPTAFSDVSGSWFKLIDSAITRVSILRSGISYFNGGYVGIGQTTAAYPLDVLGITRSTGLIVGTLSGVAKFTAGTVGVAVAGTDYLQTIPGGTATCTAAKPVIAVTLSTAGVLTATCAP